MQFTVILLSLFSAVFCRAQSHLHLYPISAAKLHSSTTASSRSDTEYIRLVKRLRSSGASAKVTAELVRQPFFSVSGRIINVNGESVQVFKFANAAAAEAQAKGVAPDGMTIGTSKPSWMAPPHFFKGGKLIVLYVGANESVLKVLEASLGTQFAGS
ncbi:MAG: hypothetical protein ABI698_10190 [bacterium]